jgi:hypothetical protein
VPDLPPDLLRLRTLETFLLLTLDEVREAIAAAERREEERQRGLAARPPSPDWLIETGLSGRTPAYVHTGDCWNVKKKKSTTTRAKAVDRTTALHALTEGGVPACTHCRPDTALGILEAP